MFISDTTRYNILRKITCGHRRAKYQAKWERLYNSREEIDRRIQKVRAGLKRKVAAGKKLRVLFVCFEKSQWNLQSIYDAMAADAMFMTPQVYTCAPFVRNTENEGLQDLIRFFRNKGMETVTEIKDDALPDIIFSNRHDYDVIRCALLPAKYHDRILYCYHTYCALLSEGIDWYYLQHENLRHFWRIYTDCEPDRRSASSAFSTPGKVVCCGNPKNDCILAAPPVSSYWKQEHKKRIIWAPHWSINSGMNSSTFALYCHRMLDYARNHPDMEFIIKPHPALRKLITDKDMQRTWMTDFNLMNGEEYDAYMDTWRKLPNTNVMDSGDYFSLFQASDAMILDISSFMAEYIVVNKPMCLCYKESGIEEARAKLRPVGKDLLEGMTPAFTWDDIVHFIEHEVMGNHDSLRQQRERAIRAHMDFNRGMVGNMIVRDIIQGIVS